MTPDLVATLSGFMLLAVVLVVILRILLRPNREPASRVAWVIIVITVPLAGVIAYLILGEVRIGRRHLERVQKVHKTLPPIGVLADPPGTPPPNIPDRYTQLFKLGSSISGFIPVGGNRVELAQDSNQAIDWLVADIDAASHHVHLLFYIWLEDNNGRRVAEALQRAAARGVTCRAMVDALGSRAFIKSKSWKDMRSAGVNLRVAMPIGSLLMRPLRSRIDIRNHRKVVVIDNRITYCGSQNCADPEFRIKARYAPWIDIMLRLEGPVAMQNQYLFAGDWMADKGDDIAALLQEDNWQAAEPGPIAQVIATGPILRNSAMPEIFVSMIYSARRQLVITTPYYVPNQPMQDALCASAYRGVNTTLIVPARNDSRFVAAASRSYYADLLAAGVHIYEYAGGLLHSKSVTVDGELCLIGSANMDRRSVDLNFENNMLILDAGVAAALTQRQLSYINGSIPMTEKTLRRWSPLRRLWNNISAILSPVL